KALRGNRERAFVFTKCGTVSNGRGFWKEDLSPANIRREVECSLRNLQSEYIDLYQFHDVDESVPVEESWGTMQELIREGKVRYGGLSNHTPELIARAMGVGRVTSNQHQYSILRPEIEADILPLSENLRIGVLGWSPLASGFLTDE